VMGGLGLRPRTDSTSPRYGLLPHTHLSLSSSLHGKDFPLTLVRGSPDGTVEPDRHRQETIDLAT
jgi:hypothetical protein